MAQPQRSHDRQIAASEKETLQRLFPREEALDNAYFKGPGPPYLMEQSTASPDYYKDLVTICTSPANLTKFSRGWVSAESLPLFESNSDGELVVDSRNSPAENLALTLTLLLNVAQSHFELQLQHESRSILEQKTTSNEQLERISRLLRDYGA